MSTLATLVTKLVVDASDFQTGLGQAETGASGWASKVGGFLKGAIPVAAIVGGIAAVGAGLLAAGKAAAEEEEGIAKLSAAVKASGGEWGTASDEIESYLAAELKRTALDDGPGREAISRLTTTTGDYRKALELMPLVQDLARAKGMDLAAAAEIVGKVSEGNTGILSRYGIVLDKGATSQDALAAMQTKFAGQAEGYGNTTSGAQDKLRIAMGNLKETVGTAVLPIMSKLAETGADLAQRALPIVEGAVRALGPVFTTVFTWIQTNVMPILSTIVGYVVANWPTIQSTISTVLDQVWAVVQLVLGLIQAFWGAFGDTILAAAALIWAYIQGIVKAALEVIQGIIQTVTSLIKGDWQGVWEGIQKIFTGVWDYLQIYIKTILGLISLIFGGTWTAIQNGIQTVWTGIAIWLANLWTSIRAVLTAAWEAVVAVFRAIWTVITWIFTNLTIPGILISHWTQIRTAINTAWNAISGFFSAIWTTITGAVTGAAGSLRDALAGIWTSVSGTASRVWTGIRDAVTGFAGGLWTNVSAWITSLRDRLFGFWQGIRDTAAIIWAGITNRISTFASDIYDAVTAWVGALKGRLETFWAAIWDNVARAWVGLRTTISTVASGIWTAIEGALGSLWDKWNTFWERLKALPGKMLAGIHIPMPHVTIHWDKVLGVDIPTSASVAWYGAGADFLAMRPMLIGVGEAGAERVQVTPVGERGGAERRTVNNFYLNANYSAQRETSLAQDIKLLQMLYAKA